ncbi:MAG: AI-2E family transporter [Prevotella sp.]|nr:AI-2E family transporter [Prevotella sp.]
MQKEITFDRFIRWTGIGLLVLAILLLMNYLSSVLLPFFIAWFMAYLLYPIVKFVQYKMHVPTRALSIIVTLIFVIAVVGGVVYLIIPPMIEQFQKLGELATKYIHNTAHITSIPETIQGWIQENQARIDEFFRSKDFTDALKTAMPQLFSFLGQTASVIISIVASLITLLYMFFILLDYEYLTENWIKIFPKKVRPFWSELMQDVERELNNYIRGQGLVALTMGVLFCIGFTIIDFPMAIGLGILIGILDLVPYLHTFALIPTALLALLKAADTGQNFWITLISAVAVFAIVQVIIDMIVTPKIMGKAMGLNPAILLLSLSVWGALLGFIGLIIALPLTTLLIAYYQRYVTRELDEDENSSETSVVPVPESVGKSVVTPSAPPDSDSSATEIAIKDEKTAE